MDDVERQLYIIYFVNDILFNRFEVLDFIFFFFFYSVFGSYMNGCVVGYMFLFCEIFYMMYQGFILVFLVLCKVLDVDFKSIFKCMFCVWGFFLG